MPSSKIKIIELNNIDKKWASTQTNTKITLLSQSKERDKPSGTSYNPETHTISESTHFFYPDPWSPKYPSTKKLSWEITSNSFASSRQPKFKGFLNSWTTLKSSTLHFTSDTEKSKESSSTGTRTKSKSNN